MTDFSRTAILRRIRHVALAHRAMLILANQIDVQQAIAIEESLAKLPSMSIGALRAFYARAKHMFDRDKRALGAKCPRQRYVEVLAEMVPAPQTSLITRVPYINKGLLETLFDKYPLPSFLQLPKHARILIYPAGRPAGCSGVWYLLEAALFEDMACLWNLTMRTETEAKTTATLTRATSRAVFHFLEGFLNGLGFQVRALHGDCSPKDIQLLFEMDLGHIQPLLGGSQDEVDLAKLRPRYATLREKLLQYPKMAVGAQHPPLSESNCPAMGTVLALEDEYRNWLVHPSPRPNIPDGQPRDGVFIELTSERLAKLIDASIELVQRIANTVGPLCEHTTLWLHVRGKDGLFHDDVFK